MAMKESNRFSQFKSKDNARLIPTVAESKKEERATSALLAVFRIVPKYAFEMLREVGAPVVKRARIDCLTEVVPKNQEGKLRPDGFLSVTYGKKSWSALIESKVGTAHLGQEQIEKYVVLARNLGCDALITISNQYATLPTHHPISVNKSKLGKLGLFHFSWLSLASKAKLLSDQGRISDPEQTFILEELLRYLEHKYSGVSLMTQMGSGWRSVSERVRQGINLLKSSEKVDQAVASWHQLTRYLVLRLGVLVGERVDVHLPRSHKTEPAKRIKAHIDELCTNQTLTEIFEVPDAASRIKLQADFARRSITLSMCLDAPTDKARAPACINWLTRQLRSVESENVLIKANWPGRTPSTMSKLSAARENPQCLVPNGIKVLPKSLEVVQNIDMMSKFKAKQKFVELSEQALRDYYNEVGQQLRRWVPPAPKVKESDDLSSYD